MAEEATRAERAHRDEEELALVRAVAADAGMPLEAES
jgi:hypothetical protein